jgi:serine phosphatase RsbU (regulator of sigma subunit)
MAQLRNALRAYLIDGHPPVEAVARLNDFVRLLVPGAYATLVVALLDPTSGGVDAVLAGHPVPLILPECGVPSPAPLLTSPPVGVPGARYLSRDFNLAPGEGLVLYSDGIVERRDEDMPTSIVRLSSQLDASGRDTTATSVFAALESTEAPDDRTVVVLRRAD